MANEIDRQCRIRLRRWILEAWLWRPQNVRPIPIGGILVASGEAESGSAGKQPDKDARRCIIHISRVRNGRTGPTEREGRIVALWLIRSGAQGQHEQRFLDESRVYVTWDGLSDDLQKLEKVEQLRELLHGRYPELGTRAVINYAGQIWPFVTAMKPGDWVVMPAKNKAAIHFGEIAGDYVYNPSGPDPYFHYRKVKWFAKDIPRERFAQDLLYSFGAFMAICEIRRNDAEARVHAMADNGWKAEKMVAISTPAASDDEEAAVDLEQLAMDSIAKAIMAKFKGHGLARLVDAILRAQGYTTYLSPAGADKGVDILAAPEALGFGQPRLCVQVKSEHGPVDRPTLDQLIGTMQNFHADQGLLVSWGGFKASVQKELPNQFFRVRLWDQQTLISELVRNYEKLSADLCAELPLKQIWTVATDEDDGG